MEDSHIADINLGNDTSLFGVFDGHGGKHNEKLRKIKNNFQQKRPIVSRNDQSKLF